MKKHLLLFAFLSICFFNQIFAQNGTATTKPGANGAWNSTSTWVGDSIPTWTSNTITINSDATVNLDQSRTFSVMALNGILNDNGFTLTLIKNNATPLTGSGTHVSTGSGSITLTGNKLVKIQNTPTTSPLTLGNLTINQATAATGYNNICIVNGGVLIITGNLTLNSSGVFSLYTKSFTLNSPVVNPQYFVSTITAGDGSVLTNGAAYTATGTLTIKGTATIPANVLGTTPLTTLNIDLGTGNTTTLLGALTMAGKINILSGNLNTGIYALATVTPVTATNKINISPNAALVAGNSGSINFNNDTVILQSTSAGSGIIVGNNSANGGISNATAVTVQRYIGSSTQWRMVGFPFTAATTLSQSTLSGFYTTGFGAYTYDETKDDGNYAGSSNVNAGWTGFTSGTITSDKGLLLVGGPTSTVNFTGPINTGTQSIALSYTSANTNKNGWNLIANPFASNINWTSIQTHNTSNLDNAIYRFNPNGAYASYVNTVAVNGGDPVIENGASFFVHSTGATTLSVQESDKVSTAPAASLFGVDPSVAKSIIKLSLQKEGETSGDEVVVRWGVDAATDNFDGKYDAYDLGRMKGADLSVIGSDGTNYSIFHGSALQIKDREQRAIALGAKNLTEGNYSINAALLSDMYDGNEVYLIDHYTNQSTLISANSAAYTFSVTSNTASAAASRFSIALNYQQKTAVAANNIMMLNNPSTGNKISLISGSDYQKLSWQLVDNTGRMIQTGSFNNVVKGAVNTASTPAVSTGMYFIKLNGDGNALQTQKWIRE